MNLNRPVLKLNASYEPLGIITVRRALELMVRGKAVGVEDAPLIVVARGLAVASAIRLKNYRRVPVRLQVVSRRNILIRDGNRCMYCGYRFKGQELTLDHIVPRSRGGRYAWENLVACCQRDNHRKGDRTPEEAGMALLRRPLPQTMHTQRYLLRLLSAEINEPSWSKYLWADAGGDQRYAFN